MYKNSIHKMCTLHKSCLEFFRKGAFSVLKELYENIHFSSELPVKCFLSQHGRIPPHWHQSMELILVLEGEINAVADGERFSLKPEDLILINSNTVHELSAPAAVSIVLQFSPEVFDLTQENTDNLTFFCNSAVDPEPERYKRLRSIIALLVRNNASTNAGTAYKNSALYFYLIGELVEHFRASASETVKRKRKHAARMTAILEYIDEHYAENFSLSDLAERQQLSVPYLSSFFNKQMGIGFSRYYTDVKLEHAVYALTSTDDPIETVAAKSGFPESHAFVRAFKKKYGILPSVFRKQYTKQILASGSTSQTNYLKLEPTNYLHLLTRYLDAPALPSTEPVAVMDCRGCPEVSVLAPGKPLRHTFRQVTTVGRASDLLRQDILSMLQELQDAVGFRYIKFHGLLGDDMMPLSRDGAGNLHFNFTLIDQALENLQKMGLKPWVELSFMPSVLASDPGKTIFQLPFNTSPPADLEEWVLLVDRLVRHLISRFGQEEIVTWPFTVWCEPDTPTSMFGWEDPQLFFQFYRRTRQAVKAVCPDIAFGSPALLYMRHGADPIWMRHFFAFALKNGCCPEFLNIHYYADMLTDSDSRVGLASSSRLPMDHNDFRDFITAFQSLAAEYGFDHLPIYLTEWNLTFSHRNLINDTCYKSCYIAKNLLENYDRLESFGYWSLTDLLAENALPEELFHGGMGLFTLNGIRKPVFHLFRLLRLLGDDLLSQGEGYFVTRKGSGIRIITYHYVHYGSLFAAGEAFNITQTERYGIFDMSRKLSLTIPLTGLPAASYRLREFFLNREHGSAFDEWLKSGALPINAEEAAVLDQLASPGYHQTVVAPEDKTFRYCPTLEPLEVRLAVLEPECS